MYNILYFDIRNNRLLRPNGIFFLDVSKHRIPYIIISGLIDQFLERTFILRLIIVQSAVIQFLTDPTPIRHIPIHVGNEYSIMFSGDQMRQFMKDNIIETSYRFLSQLQIKPKFLLICTAGTPFCDHVLCLPGITLKACHLFPFRKSFFYLLFQYFPIFFLHISVPLLYRAL